jgi:hypothetical protein
MFKAALVALMLSTTVAYAQEYDPKTGLNEYGETQEQAERLQDLADHQRNDYLPVVLICPAGMPRWQCSPVKGFSRASSRGQKASNLMACFQNGNEMAAKAGMFSNLADGEYIKVMCPHEKGTVEETGEGKL